MHELHAERLEGQHLATDVSQGSTGKRHLEVALGWADGLRCGAGEFDVDSHQLEASGLVVCHTRVIVPAAERIDAVEDEVGAAVPEVAQVEDRVDHGRRVPRLDAPDLQAVAIEDLVAGRLAVVHQLGSAIFGDHAEEPDVGDSL